MCSFHGVGLVKFFFYRINIGYLTIRVILSPDHSIDQVPVGGKFFELMDP